MSTKLVAIIGAFILLVLGVLFTIPATQAVTNAKQSQAWPVTSGRLISNDFHKRNGSPGYRSLRYEYTFAGKKYESGRVSFGMQSDAADLYQRALPGAALKVYVNPEVPGESVLVPGTDGGAKYFILFGTLALALSGYIGFLAVRMNSSDRYVQSARIAR